MSEREDIVRWSSDPRAPEGMRALVRAANAGDHGPSAAELASLRARMAAQLAPATAPATAALLSVRTIIVGLLVVGVGTGIIGALASRPDPQVAVPIGFVPPPPVPVPPPPAPQITSIAVPPPPPPPVAAQPPRPHVAPKQLRTAPVAPAPEPAPAPVTPPPPRISEVAVLEQARAALRGGQPVRTLALTEQHAALYADGILVEEREALAIEALLELGRNAEAAAKWSKFAAAYPHSNYHARLQRKIEMVR